MNIFYSRVTRIKNRHHHKIDIWATNSLKWELSCFEREGTVSPSSLTSSLSLFIVLEDPIMEVFGDFIFGSARVFPRCLRLALCFLLSLSCSTLELLLGQKLTWKTCFVKKSLQVPLPWSWDQKNIATSSSLKTFGLPWERCVPVGCGHVCVRAPWADLGACRWVWGHRVWGSVRQGL